MKKLMKTAAIILSAAMMLSMTACGQKEDPKAVYDASVQKNADLKSMDMDSTSTMKMTQGDSTLDIDVSMNIKAKDMNMDQMELLMTGTTSTQGQNIETTSFYKDGYFYADAQNQKIKYAMDLASIMDVLKKNNTTATSADMTKISMKKDGDNKIITYTINPDSLNTLIQNSMGSLSGSIADLKDMKLDVKSANGECTINKDGYYTNVKLSMNYDMTLSGTKVTVEMNTDGTVHNPGQTVDFTLPDTDGYQEIQNPTATDNK